MRRDTALMLSEVKDEIGRRSELRVSAAAVVRGLVIGVLEAQLWTNLNGSSDPFGQAQRVL